MSWNKRVAARMQRQAQAMDNAGKSMIRGSLVFWIFTILVILILVF